MNRFLKSVMAWLFVCIVSLLIGSAEASAAPKKTSDEDQHPLLFVTKYSVTNQSIIPGKEFTLKLTIENYSSKETAHNIVVMMNNPSGIVPEYSSVSVNYLDSIGPKETKNIKFKYTADPLIDDTELNFEVYIAADETSTTTPIRIPVGREGDFAVDEYSVPEKYEIGKTEYISALVENISDKEMSNVVMTLRCNDVTVASENIGTISVGTSKTQYVSALFSDLGTFPYELVLVYTDGTGVGKEYSITTGMLTVVEKLDSEGSSSNTATANPQQNQQIVGAKSGSPNIVVICSIGILLIIICCVVLLLLYRRE
ncbi:MAG: hypothetical protein E7265_11475 [Lachnospiraceae bacterium]|nr:hypothetical protein [Lachnospiraceae bacterium]